jgi:hypothetical protein
VLAVLLAWIAQAGAPLAGVLLLTAFAAGQVLPLLLAGTAAAWVPRLLALRALGQWVPPVSGALLLITTLRKGQTTSVPLRAGVRLRAGRPDLLELAAADQPFRTFGAVGDLGWQTVMADDTPNQARRNVPPAASGKP